MTNYLAFTPESFGYHLTQGDFIHAIRRASSADTSVNLSFKKGQTRVEVTGEFWIGTLLSELSTTAAIETDKHVDKVVAQVIEELTEAIRLSLECIGTQKLQARPGWAWFDALVKYAPHKAELFGPVFPDAPAEPAEEATKAAALQEEEAVSLSYWLAQQLGEHVDDAYDRGETLTDTVQRLIEHIRPVVPAPTDDGYVNVPTWQEVPDGVTYHPEGRGLRYVNRGGQPYYAGMSTPLSATFEQLEDFMRPQGPFYFIPVPEEHATHTDTATGPGQDPEDKPDIEPNAMAVWANDTDERVIVYRWDTRPDGSLPDDPNRYVRGAFNKNGDFVTLDRLREIPDGYRKVNWGQAPEGADA